MRRGMWRILPAAPIALTGLVAMGCGSTTLDIWLAPEATFEKAANAKDKEAEMGYIDGLAAVGQRAARVCRRRLEAPSATPREMKVALLVLALIKDPSDRELFVGHLTAEDLEVRRCAAMALYGYSVADLGPMLGDLALREPDLATQISIVELLGRSKWDGRFQVLGELRRTANPEQLDTLTRGKRLRDAIVRAEN